MLPGYAHRKKHIFLAIRAITKKPWSFFSLYYTQLHAESSSVREQAAQNFLLYRDPLAAQNPMRQAIPGRCLQGSQQRDILLS
jgi:hypothetical protein